MTTQEKMMNKVSLNLAFDHYDRHVPFLDKSVTLDEVELNPMVVGQSNPGPYGKNSHQRMLKQQEFDMADSSSA